MTRDTVTPKKSILLVEDDPLAGELVDFVLTRAGYAVTWLRDGREAEAYIETGPVTSLVLLDLSLPYVSGLDLLHQLQQATVWSVVPALFLTGSDDESDITRAFEAGASDYISKPFRPAELAARIARSLQA